MPAQKESNNPQLLTSRRIIYAGWRKSIGSYESPVKAIWYPVDDKGPYFIYLYKNKYFLKRVFVLSGGPSFNDQGEIVGEFPTLKAAKLAFLMVNK